MTDTLHLLKSFRERTGVSLQDMATIIGMDIGKLSKIENGKQDPNLLVLFSYHLILKIPFEKLFKNHYPKIIKDCLRNALALKDKLMENMTSPHIDKRLMLVDTIVDRLVELDNCYDS
ncbi:MAG: helix-turn-helix domain-containing protein [Xanthomarina gelatinilytica]|uniref:helix-turn-helix domain-containing protein n=1 Tax=Xanthomarina gelatinilytica TaxID=1137281 RepID=UPI003A857780